MEQEKLLLSSRHGAVFAGGEPAFQPEFCLGILKACKYESIDTAMKTFLFCEKDVLENLVDYVDLFLVDMKLFNPVKHEHYTGKPNYVIKENLRYLATTGKDILVRVPVIKNITDKIDNYEKNVKFVNEIDPGILIEFLDFNLLTKRKYQKLSIHYSLE